MPIFSDKIIIPEYSEELKLGKEFKFRIDKFNLELKGYNLKKNENNQFEFTSIDTVYKIPRGDFRKGDKVTILDQEDKKYFKTEKVISREFLKQKEENFKNLLIETTEDNPRFVSIDCKIKYNKAQMNWILVGASPNEMEDRIIMYSKEDKILIYSSWGNNLIFEAQYKRIWGKQFLIYKINALKKNIELRENKFIEKFEFQMKCHLEHQKWIDKWAKENIMKIKA